MLMKLEYSPHIFGKYSYIEFHENTFTNSRDVPCGRTDMTTVIAAFRNFANAPKNSTQHLHFNYITSMLLSCAALIITKM